MFEWINSSSDRRSSPRLGIAAVEAARDLLGGELPAEFAEQLDLVDRAERRATSAALATAPAELAVLDALAADPEADVDRLLLAAQVADLLRAATRKAAALRRVGHARFFHTHADQLIRAISDGPFQTAVDALQRASALPSLDPLEMAKHRRTRDVEVLADAMAAFAVVVGCSRVRDQVVAGCGGQSPKRSKFGKFRNPADTDHEAQITFDGFVANIRAGGDPWLPTGAQIAEAERKVLQDW